MQKILRKNCIWNKWRMNFQNHFLFFFNKRKARITYSDTEKNWLRNAGLHQQQLQSIQRWNAITVQSHRIENTTFDFENRHNKSRHLSEIILPFTFKLNRHQEEYRFEQVSSKKEEEEEGKNRRSLITKKQFHTFAKRARCGLFKSHHLSTDRLERGRVKRKESSSLAFSIPQQNGPGGTYTLRALVIKL